MALSPSNSLRHVAESDKFTIQGKLRGPIRKIFVLRHGALGDVILEVPALEALRRTFPEAHITLLCDPVSGPVLEGLDFYDSMIVLHEKLSSKSRYYWELIKLRRNRYDLLIAMRGSGRYRWQTLLIGGRNRHGHPSSSWIGSRFFTMTGAYVPGKHQVENALKFFAPLGIRPPDERPSLKIVVTDENRQEADELLKEAGVGDRFIVFHPTHRERPWFENWADEKFAYVSDQLAEAGYQIVLTTGEAQRYMAERILAKCKLPVVDLTGRTSPRVLAAICERALLYVGYNTGGMHVAAAVGTPIVAIFEEPNNYEKWKPWTDAPFRILAPGVVYHSKPEEGDVFVTETVPKEAVLAAAKELLELPRDGSFEAHKLITSDFAYQPQRT